MLLNDWLYHLELTIMYTLIYQTVDETVGHIHLDEGTKVRAHQGRLRARRLVKRGC